MSRAIKDVDIPEDLKVLELSNALAEAKSLNLAVFSKSGECLYCGEGFNSLAVANKGQEYTHLFATQLGSDPLFKKQWRKSVKNGENHNYGPIEIKTGKSDLFIVGEILPAGKNDVSDKPLIVTAVDISRYVEKQSQLETAGKQFDLLAESLDAAVVITDVNGTIISWNNNAEDLFSTTQKEAEGRNISAVLEHEAEFLAKAFTAIEAGQKSIEADRVVQLQDDKRALLRALIAPISQHTHKSGYMCIFSNVTEERLGERQRQQQLEILAHAQKLNSTASTRVKAEDMLRVALEYITGLAGDSFALAFLYDRGGIALRLKASVGISEDTLDSCDYPQDELLSLAASKGKTTAWKQETSESLSPMLASLHPSSLVVAPIISNSSPIGAILLGARQGAVLRSWVTSLLEVVGETLGPSIESAVRFKRNIELEEYSRTLFEKTTDMVVVLDRTGIIIDANPGVKNILGYTKGEMLGKTLIEFMSPESRADLQETIGDTMAESVKEFNCRLTTKDSDKVDISVKYEHFVSGGRKLFVFTGKDISALKAETKKREVVSELALKTKEALNQKNYRFFSDIFCRLYDECEVSFGITGETDEQILAITMPAYDDEPIHETYELKQVPFDVQVYEDIDSNNYARTHGAKDRGVKSIARVPLLSGKEVIGVIEIGLMSRKKLGPDEIAFLRDISMIVSKALIEEEQVKTQAGRAEKLERLFNTIDAAALLVDDQGSIEEANNAAIELFAAGSREAIIGKNMDDVFTYSTPSSVLLRKASSSSHKEFGDVRACGEKEGRPVIVTVSSWSGRGETGQRTQIVFHDAGISQDAYSETMRANGLAKIIYAASVELNRTLDLNTISETSLQMIVKNTEFNRAVLYVVDKNDPCWLSATAAVYEQERGQLWPKRIKIGEGLAGTAAAIEEIQLQKDEVTAITHINIPLICGGAPVGIISMDGKNIGAMDPSTDEFIKVMAEIVAQAINNALSYVDLKDKLQDLESKLRANTADNSLISELTKVAAQQIRSLAVTTKGQTQALAVGALGDLNTQQKEKLQKAASRYEELLLLAESIIGFSGLMTGTLKPQITRFGAADMLSQSLDSISLIESAEAHQIKAQIDPQGLIIKADERMLICALSSAAHGMISMCPNGAGLDIRIYADNDDNNKVAIDLNIESAVDSEKLAHSLDIDGILSPSLTEQEKASRINLAAAKGIVKAHGGRIWVDSKTGSATMHIRLPQGSSQT